MLLSLAMVLGACGNDAPSSSDPVEADQTVAITATEYRFAGDPSGIEVGETIRFEVTNAGGLDHELQVLAPGGRLLGRTARIPPGGSDAVTVEFESAGDYRLICDIDDHQVRGQVAFITLD